MQIRLVGCEDPALPAQLQQMGYELTEGAAEAILYTGTQIPQGEVGEQGALLIPLEGRSPEEIQRVLETRFYDPLFSEKKYF